MVGYLFCPRGIGPFGFVSPWGNPFSPLATDGPFASFASLGHVSALHTT
jgi:hypothetical protein